MKRTIALILSMIMLLSPTVMAYADAGTDAAELGFSYLRGNGVPQDYEKALENFLEADRAGNTQVQFSVGEIYEYGHGVKKDLVTAVKWYMKAAQLGNSEAAEKLKQEPLRSINEAMSVQKQATHVPGTYGDVEGVRGPTYPWYPDFPLINLEDITLVITFTRWISGWPYGNWYLYVRDENGDWHHTSVFKLNKNFGEGQTMVLHLETDQRETATALALCPADKGMDYAVQFDTIFFASEDNVGEYSSKLLKPRFNPAKSDRPVFTVHTPTQSYTNPAQSLADALMEELDGKDYYPDDKGDYPVAVNGNIYYPGMNY